MQLNKHLEYYSRRVELQLCRRGPHGYTGALRAAAEPKEKNLKKNCVFAFRLTKRPRTAEEERHTLLARCRVSCIRTMRRVQ